MSVHNLRMYNEAVDVATEIALTVRQWKSFDQSTIGTQVMRSADSISTNIAEGSCQETKNHLLLAQQRSIMAEAQAQLLCQRLTSLSISIMAFCKKDLTRFPKYKGGYRSLIERRTAFLNRPSGSPEGSPASSPSG